MDYYLFPSRRIDKNDEIIIWGYGYVGKCYIEQILKLETCKLLFVVDSAYKEINSPNVKAPEIIKEYSNCKVVIANSNLLAVNQIKTKLDEWNVDGERVIYDLIESEIFKNNIIDWFMGKMNELSDISRSNGVKLDNLKRICTSIECDIRDERGGNDKRLIRHIESLSKYFSLCSQKNTNLLRVGNKNDGGYVMIDDFDSSNNKIAYSFGISDEISWDEDMAQKGYEVFMYDHTVDSIPSKNPKMHFFKTGICGDNNKNPNLRKIDDLLMQNGHANNYGMILKMDVEGAEYDFLESVNEETLKRFDQIVMEMHFITNPEKNKNIVTAFEKLNRHHKLIHLHGNNYSECRYINNQIVYDSIEVLYALKDKYTFADEFKVDTIDVDSPNDIGRIDLEVLSE